jgi:RNA polymerase sigma-70 factor (ECF subfamily)
MASESNSRKAGEVPPTGDAAFETALERLLVAIWLVARTLARRFGFGDEADDVATDVTMELAARLRWAHARGDDAEFDEMTAARDLTPWVRADVSHRGIDRRRKEHAALRHSAVFHAGWVQRSNTSMGPDVRIERRELRRRVEEALARMTPEHRAVVALKIDRKLGWDEVARRLGVSKRTARRRLAEALTRLGKSLSDYRDWAPRSELGLQEDVAP